MKDPLLLFLSLVRRSATLLILTLILQPAVARAGSITLTNVDSSGLSSSNPVIDNAGVPLPPGGGFAAVGSFRTLTDDELRNVSMADRSMLHSEFVNYGSNFGFGHFGFDGLYSATATRTTPLIPEFVGKPIYTVVGNSGTLQNSTELLIYKHSDQPGLADDPFSADADLSDTAGELIVGFFGELTDVSDGALVLRDLPAYRLARLPNDLVGETGACTIIPARPTRTFQSAGGNASHPSIAANLAGRSAITWSTTGILGFKCRFSIFDSDGTILVDETDVDGATIGQFGSVVAMRGDGSLVIAWLALADGGPEFHAFARRFAPDGDPIGGAIQVSTTGLEEFISYRDSQGDDEPAKLSVAIHDATGDFAIGFGGPDEIFVRLYDAAGNAKGDPITLDEDATADLGGRALGMSQVGIDAAGNVYVAHRNELEVTLAKFDSSGAPAARAQLVTDSSLNDADPRLNVEADGNLLVGWFENDPQGGSDAFMRRWHSADLQPLSTGLKSLVDASLIGAAQLANCPPQVPHWTAFIDPNPENFNFDLFANGGRQLVVPQQLLVERDFDYNQDTWRIAAGGGGLLLFAHEEESSGSLVVRLRRWKVRTAGEKIFSINQTTARFQTDPDVASSAAGHVVTVWVDDPGTSDRIMGRLYDTGGNPLGDEFVISPDGTDDKRNPRVAMAPDGRFVVAWGDDIGDSDGRGVRARRYAADGTPLGDEFLVNESQQAGSQTLPVVAVGPDGSFVIAFETEASGDQRVVFQRYDPAGNLSADATPVANPAVGIEEVEPSIAMNSAGKFAIAWERRNVPSGGSTTREIYIRSYAADGTALVDPVRVAPQGRHFEPAVAINDNDEWVVAWQSEVLRGGPDLSLVASRGTLTGTQPTRVLDLLAIRTLDTTSLILNCDGLLEVAHTSSSPRLQGLRFDAQGNSVGEIYEINSDGNDLRMAALPTGERFAVWGDSFSSLTQSDIYGRVFDYTRNYSQFQQGTEQLANVYRPDDQENPRVAVNEAGMAAVVWDGELSGTDDAGVAARLVNPDGSFVRAEDFHVDRSTLVDSGLPDVTWINPEQFFVAWSEETEDGGIDVLYQELWVDPLVINLPPVPLESGLLNFNVRVAADEGDAVALAWIRKSNIFSSDGEMRVEIIANGTNLISNRQASSSDIRQAFEPSVDLAGEYAIFAWRETDSDTDTDNLVLRLYRIVGGGNGVQLRSTLPFGQIEGRLPTVAVRDDGSSVLAWIGPNADGLERLHVRCLSVEFDFIGNPIEIEARTGHDLDRVEIAMDAEGCFTLVWEEQDPNPNSDRDDVYMRRFDRLGFPIDRDFQRVPLESEGDQKVPDISLNGSGNGLIAWQDTDPISGDNDIRIRLLTTFNVRSGFDVWAESFDDPEVIDPLGDPDCDRLNNLLEYIMNLDPLMADDDEFPLPTLTYDDGAEGWSAGFSWRQRNDDASIVATLQESSDLKNWSAAATVSNSVVIDELTDLRIEGTIFPETGLRKYYRLHFELDAGE